MFLLAYFFYLNSHHYFEYIKLKFLIHDNDKLINYKLTSTHNLATLRSWWWQLICLPIVSGTPKLMIMINKLMIMNVNDK